MNLETFMSTEFLGAIVKYLCDDRQKREALIIMLEMAKKGVFANAIMHNT